MRPGLVLADFAARDGRRVVVRTPRWEDLDDLLGLINSLVEEEAEIVVNERVTRDGEAEWLAGVLARLERDEVVHLVAEVEGKVIASADLHPGRGSDAHVGVVGIVVKCGFRGVGVGARMLGAIVDVARKRGLRLLVLSVFASNVRAVRLYERGGFVRCGLVPLRHFSKGKYVDEVLMAKSLV
jgi:L-amino acid N-acyltransferase YncA